VKYRYQYLAGGVNTGGGSSDPNCGTNKGWQTWNSPAGAFVTDYIANTVPNRIPVFTYYELVQSNPVAGSDRAADELIKISTLCTMQAYWADFTVLMQKAGAYGGQVVIHVEPDFWGMMENTGSAVTSIPADVANTGNADLAGLPNSLQGMAWAFLTLRDKYAPNALLAIHLSSWQGGMDIATDQSSPVSAAVSQADTVSTWVKPAGFVGNPSGVSTWDLVFNDVADHDAGSYGATSNPHWWDKNNVLFPNFTRWLAFMSRLNTDLGVPLVEWQVPVGNQYFDTENNTPGHYQDNRIEYFLAHPAELFAAGIVAVLVGKANANQTNYWDELNDGITNPAPVVSWECNLCNNHTSAFADDDGGFIRIFIAAYENSATGCSSVSLSSSPSGSATTGTTVTLTASATGCPNASPLYQFWIAAPGGSWQVVQPYSTAPTFPWITTAPAGTYSLSVWVRDAKSNGLYGNNTGRWDAYASSLYTLNLQQCSSVSLSEAPPTTAVSGATVTLTAAASGCPNPLYQFWFAAPGSSWQVIQPYSSSATYTWHTSGFKSGTYSLSVWTHDASGPGTSGNASGGWDAYISGSYTLTTTPCAAATLTPSPAGSAAAGTTITLTAAASGCPTPQYQFWIAAPGGNWQVVQPYSTSATYTWITAPGAAGIYSWSVWVRDATSGSSWDAYASGHYALTSSPCSAVTLSSTPPSTSSAGTTATLTAIASGCPNPQYQFWIADPGGGWRMVQAYSSSANYTWITTAGARGTYSISVWVRDGSSNGVNGNGTGRWDAYTSGQYLLT
jgi:hypothetical protein